MSTSKTWLGTSYDIPASGERNWPGLSSFLIALADYAQGVTNQKVAMRVATTSPVTVSASSDCIVVTALSVAGAVAVNLPAGVTGQWFAIVDGTGDAATNNITITPAAGQINGASTYVIGKNRAGVIIAYNGTSWTVVSEFTSESSSTGSITIKDANFTIQDDSDTTKQLKFQVSGVTAGQTRTLTVPDASTTIVGTDATQTLTNKTLTSPTLTTPTLGVATATSVNKVAITAPATSATLTLADGSTLATSGANSATLTTTGATNVTLPTTGTLATLAGSETLTNKVLTGNTAVSLISGSGTLVLPTNGTVTVDNGTYTLVGPIMTDGQFAIVDNVDTSKKMVFQASGITASTTRTLTIPDADTTIVGHNATQTLTNKTIDADSNTITNIENADIKAAAAIALNKLAATTASRALVSDASGFVTASSVTSTELGYLSGATSNIQTQITALSAITAVAKSADYTVLDNDGYRTILMTTGASDRTVTLPTAADNNHRIITVKKVDSGAGRCRVDGEGAELINSAANFDLHIIGDFVTVQCDGTKWHVIDQRNISAEQSLTLVFAASTLGTLAAQTASWRRVGQKIEVQGTCTASGSIGGSNITLTLPTLNAAAGAAVVATTHASGVYCGRWIRGNASATTRKMGNIFAIGNSSNTFVYFSSDDQTAAVSPFTAVAASGLFAASDVISFQFSVSVTDFAHWAS